MPSFRVRQIDDETVAANRGVSMEEEVRQILRDAVGAPGQGVGTMLFEVFKATQGFNEPFELSAREHSEPIDLSCR